MSATKTNKMRNAERLSAAADVASKITDALWDVGYSDLALQEIFDILINGLMAQEEQEFRELLEEMGNIYGVENSLDNDTDEEGNDETHLN